MSFGKYAVLKISLPGIISWMLHCRMNVFSDFITGINLIQFTLFKLSRVLLSSLYPSLQTSPPEVSFSLCFYLVHLFIDTPVSKTMSVGLSVLCV